MAAEAQTIETPEAVAVEVVQAAWGPKPQLIIGVPPAARGCPAPSRAVRSSMLEAAVVVIVEVLLLAGPAVRR